MLLNIWSLFNLRRGVQQLGGLHPPADTYNNLDGLHMYFLDFGHCYSLPQEPCYSLPEEAAPKTLAAALFIPPALLPPVVVS
jgi:hypothetical protein